MAENKLPTGVGKKIVEALKKQAEIEIQAVPDESADTISVAPIGINSDTEIYDNSISDNVCLDDNINDFSLNNNDDFSDFAQTDLTDGYEENNVTDFDDQFPASLREDLNFEETETPMFEEKEIFNNAQNSARMNNVQAPKNYTMPANVAVLKRLIMQLPQGVTKQTGAQIIRQTMEALGISMNSVLKEAQQGQDSLTQSAKSCMSQIADYRNSIKSLEKQVQDYKKQAIALNDLISLFIMTDKH